MLKECPVKKTSQKKIRLLDFFILFFILIAGIIWMVEYKLFKAELTDTAISLGALGIFFIIFILEVIPQLISPFLIMFALISSGFNIHIVMFSIVLGSILGSVLGFRLGKKYGLSLVCAMLEQNSLNKLFLFLNKYGYLFILVSALTPLPYFPVFFGALNISKKEFIRYGVIPRSLGLLSLGYAVYFGLLTVF